MKWFFIFTKRIYKKISFIVILLLIPVLVISLSFFAKEKSGFISVALAQEDINDKISNDIINELESSSKLVNFIYFETADKARESVKQGDCDSAWIFPSDMNERIEKFSNSVNGSNYIVNVIEREQNIALRLSHEKLSAVLYKYCAEDFYLNFIRTNFDEFNTKSDAQLLKKFYLYNSDNNLFEFAYPDSDADPNVNSDVSYLISPIRGLLSILVLLCGLAAAMYYIKDENDNTFALVPLNRKPVIEFFGEIIAISGVATATCISMFCLGLNSGIIKEIIITVLFVFSSALFCILLRQIIRKLKIFAAVIPLIITAATIVCPVFFTVNSLAVLQYIFPASYYLNSVNNNNYIIFNLIYITVLICINCVLYFFSSKKIKI